MSKKDEALKLALEALETERNNYQDWDKEDGAPEYIYEAITALRQALEQPAKQEPWADKCRIDLVTAIHFLASDFENALGAFGSDTEARRKAEGDIAYTRIVASRWNWDGTTEPAQQEPVGRLESDPDEGHVFVPRIDGDWSMLGEDLYTAPPAQRKPLPYNKEDMKDLDSPQRLAFKLGWRSAEEAHGIKEGE